MSAAEAKQPQQVRNKNEKFVCTRTQAHTCKPGLPARWISFQISILPSSNWTVRIIILATIVLVTKNLYLVFLVNKICKCKAFSIQVHVYVKLALFLKLFLISEKLDYLFSKAVNLLKISRYGNPTH